MAVQDNISNLINSAGTMFRAFKALSVVDALKAKKEKVTGELVDGQSFNFYDDYEGNQIGYNDAIDADYRILSDQDDEMVLRAKKSLIKYNKAKQLTSKNKYKQLPGGNI